MAAAVRSAVFLSYRRQDTGQTARELFAVLRERLLIDIFMDVDSIVPGESFPETLDLALATSRVVLVLIGPNWLTDRLFDTADFVHREVATALSRSLPVIPVLVQNARMPGAGDLPPQLAQLASRQAIELPCVQKVRNLIRAIELLVPPEQPTTLEPSPSQLASEVAHFQHDMQDAVETEELLRLEQAGLEPRLVIQEGHFDRASTVAFRSDGRLLASGSSDGTIRFWDVQSGMVLSVCAGHSCGIREIGFSPDGVLLASTGYNDNTVKIWDCPTGEQLQVLHFRSQPEHLQFSPDGKVLLAIDNDLRVLEVGAWRPAFYATLSTDYKPRLKSATFSPDGAKIVTVDVSNNLTFLNARTGAVLGSAQLEGCKSFGSLVYTPDGATIMATGESPAIWCFDAESLRLKRTIEVSSHGWIERFALSPDGRRLATDNRPYYLEIWDVRRGRLLASVHVRGALSDPVFSPDGQFIAGGAQTGVGIFDVNGELIRVFAAPYKETGRESKYSRLKTSICLTPDGKSVLAGVEPNAGFLWDAQTRTRTHILK